MAIKISQKEKDAAKKAAEKAVKKYGSLKAAVAAMEAESVRTYPANPPKGKGKSGKNGGKKSSK